MMLFKLTKAFPFRVTEWLLAGIMLSWSIALWNIEPADYADPIYLGLSRVAESATWAKIAFAIATIRVIALLANGAWRPSPYFRIFGAIIGGFLWLQISVSMFVAEHAPLGIAIYPWLLVADIYNVFRASHDARVSDDRARARNGAGAIHHARTAAH